MSSQGYLLDTNVVSEATRARKEMRVLDFVASIENGRTFLSVLTIGELKRGSILKRRVDRSHSERLDAWIEALERSFADRILQVDLEAARLWGELSARRPRAAVDTLIAATAITRNLTLVTRNVRDVADTGVRLLNPWE